MGVKDDYDSDDFYDGDEYGEEEEELSPEDKVSMSEGTAAVQKALGADGKGLTVKQIHEALWHYYYDVDKSVVYLRKTFLAPQTKPAPKKAPEGMSNAFFFQRHHDLFAEPTGADQQCPRHTYGGLGGRLLEDRGFEFTPNSLRRPPPVIDFSDMPWFNVPEHRKAILTPPPPTRGGLLGGGDGAPKMSKLQALAAARKKKTDEKKDQGNAAQTANAMRKMTISDENDNPKAGDGLGPNAAKRPKLSDQSKPASPLEKAPLGSVDLSNSQKPRAEPRTSTLGLGDGAADQPDEPRADLSPAQPPIEPSAFARTLFGSASGEPHKSVDDVFAMPYTAFSSFHATVFSEPSPDDVVFAAQAKAGKKAPPASKTAKKADKAQDSSSKETDLADSVSNLKVGEIPPSKSKGIDVIKEFEGGNSKKSLSFVVVGHVDAGKSTLMGRLLVDLKYVEERTVEKFRKLGEKTGKQSFALAWVMDQRSEERDRGVTIDIATNHFETPMTKFTILDAPGHRDFVPNMIAGASQADLAVVVIDANTGAYEKGLKGQTREHVLLLRSLGVQRLIIAVNKLDMVQWSQERFDEITQQITGFLTGLGFQEKSVAFIPISGLNGDNITADIKDSAASWYKGGTLIEALEASGPSTARLLKSPFRMSISEVFRSQQGTTTLAGRIDSGTMQVGEVVFVEPSGETAYIKSINVDNDGQEWAVAGQNISIALTNINPIHIRVGDILCHTTDRVPSADEFTMKAMAFEHLMLMPVDIHRGRLHAAGQIKSITATIDKATGEVIKKRPRVVQPGGVARVKIKLGSRVPLEAGQRVVIRSNGETIAAGLVE